VQLFEIDESTGELNSITVAVAIYCTEEWQT
jgi:hypothetical protein